MAGKDIYEFFYEWAEENIELQSYLDEEGDPRPKQYAEQFIAVAESEGFTPEDVASIRDRLPEMVAKYMDQTTDAEVRRLVDEND